MGHTAIRSADDSGQKAVCVCQESTEAAGLVLAGS